MENLELICNKKENKNHVNEGKTLDKYSCCKEV